MVKTASNITFMFLSFDESILLSIILDLTIQTKLQKIYLLKQSKQNQAFGIDPYAQYKRIISLQTTHQIQTFLFDFQLHNMEKCNKCGSPTLEENQQGQISCTSCGTVRENMSFSNTVTFGKNQAMEGQVVDVNEKSNRKASEKRLNRAKMRMCQLRDLLEIDLQDQEALIPGMRIIRYADSLNFFDKGKNIDLYATAAYYIALRSIKAPYLLIDFSEKMNNVSLFKLARCFLKLYKFLDFQSQLPIIDPSLYIHRYCKILELGGKTKEVTMTAIKLIQRMKRDWMCQGRRPSSLCGAAILIATKIHDVKCSTNEICKTVFVCDETIRRRLEEFKKTSVAKLTKEQFEKMDHDISEQDGEEMDPPAFQKARIKSREMEIKRKIQEQIAAIPLKDKMEKIPWQKFRDNLNIPEELLAKQVKGVERELQQARQRYEDQSFSQSEQLGYITQEEIFEQEQSEQEVDKEGSIQQDIDSEEIDKFILNDEERKLKKNIWLQHNSAWIEKEKLKSKDVQKVEKKRVRKKVEQTTGKNIFQSIKNTKLGEKINSQNLKTLLGSSPQQPKKQDRLELKKMFDPFIFTDYKHL